MALTTDKCIEGWTNCLQHLNVKADIVFFGDSLTYYGDFASVFPDKVVCNLGLRGDTLEGMLTRVEQVKLVQPDTLYLMAGINDVASCTSEEFRGLYEALIVKLKGTLPSVEIVVQSLLPVNDVDFTISCNNEQIRRCNDVIVALCSEYGLKYIDLFGLYAVDGRLPKELTFDGLHLHSEAYTKWYQALKD